MSEGNEDERKYFSDDDNESYNLKLVEEMQNDNQMENNENSKGKKKVRKMPDKNEGEWKCLDCLKNYLSYPAFYTHCKIKHQQQWPKSYSTPRPLEEIKKDRKQRVSIK